MGCCRCKAFGKIITPIDGAGGVGQIDGEKLDACSIVQAGSVVCDAEFGLNDKQLRRLSHAAGVIICDGGGEVAAVKGVVVLVVEIGIGGGVIDGIAIDEPMDTQSRAISCCV